ncbi:GNAT family N-acetyltransferase [Candidatus Falkowbacteria bacterium]|nr:GNAT family N-acetyltransferase [Candidatus Falkowbacteria bacterium]
MINIRPHSRKDLEYRVKWLNNINATRFAVDNPEAGTTLELQTFWFDKYERSTDKKFFTIECDSQPIGFMGLSDIDQVSKAATAFILIGEDDFRNRGIGSQVLKYLINYADLTLQLTKVQFEVKSGNLPAIHLYERLGFINVGCREDEMIFLWKK